MFVLIKNVHLVGTINGAPLHKNARIGQLNIILCGNLTVV